jgi:membrane protease YdiL (CAAX protease family)
VSAVEWVSSSRERGSLERPSLAGLPVAAGGIALLLARPWLHSRGIGRPGLALLYASLAALSFVASAPVPRLDLLGRPVTKRTRPILHPAVVLSVGVGAFGVAALTAAPTPPLAAGASAMALSVLAAVAEEAFFRRFLYGRLLPFGAAAAVVASATAFALVHVPLYGGAVFWVDLGAGLLFGWQRWATGSWESSAATHAVANVLAVLR